MVKENKLLKENRLKDLIEEYTFKEDAIVEVYKRICSLEAPYIWLKSRAGEKLYYIDDIQTFEGVLSQYWNNSGWELPGRCDDIIVLHLVRIKDEKRYEIEHKVVLGRTTWESKLTADQLMDISDIRIPTQEELAKEEFEDGIPGHITPNEEKVIKLRSELEAYEKEIISYKMKNEVYADMVRELNNKIEMYESKINYKKYKIDALIKEINLLEKTD